jgi:DNA-binding transcriptional ArsR family regulator
MRDYGEKIVEQIRRQQLAKAAELARDLGISSQAVHRHLKALVAAGILMKSGAPPHVQYALRTAGDGPTAAGGEIMRKCAAILRRHPNIRLVTLFGSYARGRERRDSDIDLMVWMAPGAKEGRREIWSYWDEHARGLPWCNDVSIIVARLAPTIRMHTLLLDLPEEHRVVLDRAAYFECLKAAVTAWRDRNGAVRIPSFGDTHAWRYSTKSVRLEDIDFDLELGCVA